MCGNPLKAEAELKGPSRRCAFCGTVNEADSRFCSVCSRPMGPQAHKKKEEAVRKEKYKEKIYADYPASARRTGLCSVAGIILIMVGAILLLDVVFTIAESYRETQMADFDRLAEEHPVLKSFMANIVACQAIRLVFAMLTIMGSLAAIRRMNFILAVAGCIFGILGVMMSISALTYLVWAAIIGLAFLSTLLALGMIVLSRREFMLV